MVSKSQSSSIDNFLLGQKIPHPASTKFEEADNEDFPVPPAKKVKREESNASSPSSPNGSDQYAGSRSTSTSKRRNRDEIPDSEDEGEEDFEEQVPFGGNQTLLETSLPPVKTDDEAIAEYEAYRAAQQAEQENETLHDRLDKRSWHRGRSSIYVDAFNLALETVLDEEKHLFDEAELTLFEHWRRLNYESQYLYVRLFLRKTSAWHRINKLGYHSDIADLEAAVADLQQERDLPVVSQEEQETPGELAPPEGTLLGSSFKFAECSEQEISTLEEASSLLLLDELKNIAKDAKVQGKTKKDLLAALRRTSGRQTGLGFRRSDTEESTISDGSKSVENESTDGTATPPIRENRDAHFTKKILDHTGRCIRLSLAPLKLFERIHLVFYRSTEWTEKSLTTIILAKISRRNFPNYLVSRSATIFESRALLLEFEASLRVQFKVDNILEFNGTPNKASLGEVKAIFEAVYPRWKILLTEEQRKEDRVYESGEGAYLRRFSPAWVYTRIIHKGLYPMGRFKEHKREHEVLTELLDQRLFHPSRRGAWYQRKALLEEHYMWALEPSGGRSDEAQKKHWKRIALQTCEIGLQDRDCHIIYHYDLQKRIKKLEKSLRLPLREQHDFGHSMLVKPFERSFEGIRIEKESTPSRNGNARRASSDIADTPNRRGTKTIWLDPREDFGECGVEAMCLSHYRDLGWKGYHSEGGLVRTLFGYLFYDVLFTYIPNVFQTEFQTCPLDLHTDSFYPSRYSEINHRLMEISNGEAERILRSIHATHWENRTCCVGLDWDFELDDLVEILQCFPGEALATVCKVMAQEYQARGGGVPDLFLWHPEKKEVMFSEVKSENDRLSDTQRMWIHVLMGADVRVELCHAVAKEVRIER